MANKPTKKKLGKYQVERQIGKGSAANIYLAEQNSLKRKLVIKELLPLHATNEKVIARFQREAKLISQLSHDAIIHIYDYWTRSNSNSYYIAMEYIPGPHLRKILSTVHRLPVHIAAVIIYQICRGLEYAHQNGVIHRDLKPANIMISNMGQVKILDFGVAHFQAEENLTTLGAVIGTYHYMSPEQALGKKVTAASDIFALGILFYELLTGIKPFAGENQGDTIDRIVHKNPRSVRRIHPGVTLSFNSTVKKCLKKNPKRRFQSTTEIKTRLEKFLKRYSLDHQTILREFLDNLAPTPIDENWPPNLPKRVWYRATHQRLKTYVVWISILAGIIYAEVRLISNGIGIKKQFNALRTATVSVWGKISPSDSTLPSDNIENLEAQTDTTTVIFEPDTG